MSNLKRVMFMSNQKGSSLIELVMTIVIVGIALAGLVSSLNFSTQHSVDPVVKKQALAIAGELLEEIKLMPFTWCDPTDIAMATAASAANCTGGAGGPNDESALPLGPEAGQTRYSATNPFNNVSDYNGFSMASGSILDINGNNLGLTGYSVTVVVATKAIGGVNALSIIVTVTGPLNTVVQMEGYRARYAPNEAW